MLYKKDSKIQIKVEAIADNRWYINDNCWYIYIFLYNAPIMCLNMLKILYYATCFKIVNNHKVYNIAT